MKSTQNLPTCSPKCATHARVPTRKTSTCHHGQGQHAASLKFMLILWGGGGHSDLVCPDRRPTIPPDIPAFSGVLSEPSFWFLEPSSSAWSALEEQPPPMLRSFLKAGISCRISWRASLTIFLSMVTVGSSVMAGTSLN